MEKINFEQKLSAFDEFWSPRIVGEVNESYVKVAKFQGEFLQHTHEHEDEMFYVMKGTLVIEFPDRQVSLQEGEGIIIPRGVAHMPIAHEEVHVMLIEPKTTLNTGDKLSERTVSHPERI